MNSVYMLFSDFLAALPVYLLNGFLATAYALAGAGAALTSLASAGLLAHFADRRMQGRAAFRPGRAGREAAASDPHTAQIMTALVLGLWLLAQWGMGAPVPWIGAAMWATGAGLLLVMHLQEQTLLWSVKSGIAIYALAVAGSRIYLAYILPSSRRSSGQP